MKRSTSVLSLGVMLLLCTSASGFELESPVALKAGGRFEYFVRVSRDGNGFPWNYASLSAADRTRLMLDLRAGEEKFGVLYLKTAALWGGGSDHGEERLLRFEQGEYLWQRERERSAIGLRLFANERRFFTHALIAPLLEDDQVAASGENRGVRFNGRLSRQLDITALYSALGTHLEDSRRIAYLRASFSHRLFGFSADFLHENPRESGRLNHAVLKTELVAFYRRASFIFSYAQSGFDRGLFLPDSYFHLDNYVGDNFSSILPDDGAFFAEARLAAFPVRNWGWLRLAHSYFSVGKAYVGDLGARQGEGTGYTTGIYFVADSVSLNGRLVYTRRVRSAFESEKLEKLEASLWAGLKNGSDAFLRGAIGKTVDALPFETKENFIHAALRWRLRKLRSGVHLMLKDLDTIFSERRLAWDSRLVLGGGLAFYWRMILSRDFDAHEAIYARLSFRPTNRLFAVLSYGRPFLGDGPYLLEDPDIGTCGDLSPIYCFSLRGDF